MAGPTEIKSIGIIGAGQMGNGIAHIAALSGFEIKLLDSDQDALRGAIETIDRNMERQVRRSIVSDSDRAAALGRIKTGHDYAMFKSCGIVIEAVLLTGMRIDVEALSLTWPQVDFDKGMITIGQTKTEAGTGREIPLDSSVVQRLRMHYLEQAETKLSMAGDWNPLELVFCNAAGNHISLVNLRSRVFRRVRERAGLPQTLTFHGLRYNFGSHLLSLGVDIAKISKLMGHANPGITWEIYMHEIPDDHQKAREAIGRLAVPFTG